MNKQKDILLQGLIYLSAFITVGALVFILGFIFVNGISKVNLHFLTSNYDPQTHFIMVEPMTSQNKSTEGYIGEIGAIIGINDEGIPYVKSVDRNSTARKAENRVGDPFGLKSQDLLQGINDERLEGKSVEEIQELFRANSNQQYTLRVRRPGKGVYPMIITTLYLIGVALSIAAPIGILSAIYLTEYARPGKVLRLIRFATECLSGIPSIIYGLFGMLLFVMTLNMGYSILAGALTLSIILLPVMIRTTEESLKAVPIAYREASLGLGATKLQTIRKAVLPSAVPGILVAIILSIGRIVGESAALLLTAGTVARIPENVLSGGASLTIKAYTVAKEEADIAMACAIGTVIVMLIIILNLTSKLLTKKLNKATVK
ncbi:phosphate transport system permease protein [Natranaerovirga pectinivora]|uniref:Phosphate transport system permease protein PstA n=1 Tax=Natranaerovirga pectinivora TaxID=682400 RepID=A0A4R3MRA3_9FIRM|nr:phosphate ABC transporter permease PstA [Natranaerovirga pectinivora]TCT15691.1 phosphate transport system permease protein [Natranaerovirga pectinivora]